MEIMEGSPQKDLRAPSPLATKACEKCGLTGLKLAFGEIYFLPASGTNVLFVEFI